MTATASNALTISEKIDSTFKSSQVFQIAGAHLVHDTYTGFIPTFLPVLIEKFSLSLTTVGTLTAIMQLPAILNPVIGFFADRISLHLFVILSPAITATLVGLLGNVSTRWALAMLLFATGVSVACFHAPAPAMIGRISGRKVGLGMSMFMAGGELARTLGPIVAAWAISVWTFEGSYRLMVAGWLTSAVLFLRMSKVSARAVGRPNLRLVVPALRSLYLPLTIGNLFRLFLFVCLTTYLPTLLKGEGASIWMAGGSLSILELAGVAGALTSGTLSDRIGRKSILIASTVFSTLLMFIFLRSTGWVTVPVLLALGFASLSTTPVMLAMVQDHLPENRAVANGLFMVMMFLLNTLVSVLIGFFSDRIGLRQMFYWSILLSLASIPAFLILPNPEPKDQ